MGKEWGLSLDKSDPAGLFYSNKLPIGCSMFSGTMFPVNLTHKEEEQAPSSAMDENRLVLSELDFFSDKKRSSIDHIIVKKEQTRTDLDLNTGLNLLTTNTRSDQSPVDDVISSDAEEKLHNNELVLLQVELERMNVENQRLRGMLSQVNNNYSALQMHLVALMQQQHSSRTESKHEIVGVKSEDKKHEVGGLMVPRQFMDIGPSALTEPNERSQSSSEERTISGPQNYIIEKSKNNNIGEVKGINREESPESQGWVPNKVPKFNPPKDIDQAPEATMKKARVSVRARSEAPMITDGCQWRKYGQKMAKGNPCPRAYYRCTMAVSCPVRKQVQRCAEDRGILITTYEGTHNHPLPPAAMAMASTTSAAANMLLSGSMSSSDGLMNPNFLSRAIFPSSSNMATISASAPFPTVTLDLTKTTNPSQFQIRPQSQIQNFATPPIPQVLGLPFYNQSKFVGHQLSQDHMEVLSTPQLDQTPHLPSFADTLSAATAAITADPNFTAALAAAITSIIGGGTHPNNSSNDIAATTTTTSITRGSNLTSSFPGN